MSSCFPGVEESYIKNKTIKIEKIFSFVHCLLYIWNFDLFSKLVPASIDGFLHDTVSVTIWKVLNS